MCALIAVAQPEAPLLEDVKLPILAFCQEPRSKEEILDHVQIEPKPYHFKKYITRLLQDRYLTYAIPQHPKSVNQKYITSKKGFAYLKSVE